MRGTVHLSPEKPTITPAPRPAAVCSLSAVLLLAGCTRPEPPKPFETQPTVSEQGYEESDVPDGGSIAGDVYFAGALPEIRPRPVTKNQDICGRGNKPQFELLVGPEGALENAVVLLEGIRSGKRIDPSTKTAVLDQIGCDYVPHVQVVNVGTALEIRNSDDTLHNVHGKLGGTVSLFNLAMPLKDQTIRKVLDRPGVIALQCDAGHTWMKAYVVVAENPYHARTGSQGGFTLPDVPPGTYRLKVWHERLGTLEQEVTVSPSSTTRVRFEYR